MSITFAIPPRITVMYVCGNTRSHIDGRPAGTLTYFKTIKEAFRWGGASGAVERVMFPWWSNEDTKKDVYGNPVTPVKSEDLNEHGLLEYKASASRRLRGGNIFKEKI